LEIAFLSPTPQKFRYSKKPSFWGPPAVSFSGLYFFREQTVTPWEVEQVAPEDIPSQKERIVFQSHHFSGAMEKLREGKHPGSIPSWLVNIPP